MGKTIIESKEDCRKCPCFIELEGNIGTEKKFFYLCRSFGVLLEIGVNGFNEVKTVYRCDACKRMEKVLEGIVKDADGAGSEGQAV